MMPLLFGLPRQGLHKLTTAVQQERRLAKRTVQGHQRRSVPVLAAGAAAKGGAKAMR